MIITIFGNVPIDQVIMTWTIDTMPENWTEFRDQWWTLHIWRAIVELVALVLVTWAGIRKD